MREIKQCKQDNEQNVLMMDINEDIYKGKLAEDLSNLIMQDLMGGNI